MIGRRPRRPGRFSTAPIVLGAGLVLGYGLLVRLVPSVWASVLPGGFDQGANLPGAAPIVWRLGWYCHLNMTTVAAAIVVAVAVGFALARAPVTRPVVWVLAVGIILADAAILVVTLKAGMDAAGIDLAGVSSMSSLVSITLAQDSPR